jgi:hypothetical protein
MMPPEFHPFAFIAPGEGVTLVGSPRHPIEVLQVGPFLYSPPVIYKWQVPRHVNTIGVNVQNLHTLS